MTIPENVFVKSAKYMGDYRIAFRFTDGHATEIDFHAFLTAPGQNPMATQFLDVTRFKAFAIDGRADIVWGDWEMCFPFTALYAGDLGVDSLGKKRGARVGAGPRRSIGRRSGVTRKTTKPAVK
jgi:hypothetical protein